MASEELFYIDSGGVKHDAELHGFILDGGDDDAALEVSRDLARELGLEPPDKLISKEWDESKHPRVPAGGPDGGQFGFGGGGGGEEGSSEAAPAKPPAKEPVKGLPKQIKIKDHLVQEASERGVWTMEAKEQERTKYQSGGPRYELTVGASTEGHEFYVKEYTPRAGRPERKAYYDERFAELVTTDKGDPLLESTRPVLKEDAFYKQFRKIEPLPEKDIIYRGMRSEEYEKFRETGKLESTGLYNMEGQEGLTYWATDPATAASYANGFAPWPHKATFDTPAYVVATRMPKETRHVEGVGGNEVGVARAIEKSEIVGIWRGSVYDHIPGVIDLKPASYAEGETEYVTGSSIAPTSSVGWARISARRELDDETLPPDPQEAKDEARLAREAAERAATPEVVRRDELDEVDYDWDWKRSGKFESEADFKRAKDALREYQGNGTGVRHAYSVNAALRGKKEMTPAIENGIKEMDYLFAKTAVPLSDTGNKVVYRGVRTGGDQIFANLKVGDELRDNGFVSTSHHEWFADEWVTGKVGDDGTKAEAKGGIVAKVTIPPGMKVVPVAEQLGLVELDEGEIILDRGLIFRVTKVGGKYIEMVAVR